MSWRGGAIATLTLNPAVDLSADVDRLEPERKLRCRDPRYDPGGGGVGAARMIRRLGGSATAVFTGGGSETSSKSPSRTRPSCAPSVGP